MTEKDHITRGFNAGYQLAKLDPTLCKKLQASLTDKEAPYAKGFIAGSSEFAKETTKSYTPKVFKKTNPDRSKDKGFDL
jgi:hypothetical protein